MKTLGGLATSIVGPVTTLCRTIKLTTVFSPNVDEFSIAEGLGQSVYSLTDLDVPITVAGVVYRADIGMDASTIATVDGTTQSSVDVTIILNDSYISREKLTAGLFDNAACVIQVVDWQTLDAVTYYAGNVRHITFNDDNSATLEIASLLDPNLQVAADKFSYTCRVDLGSSKCTVPISETSETFHVTAVTNKYVFSTDLTDPDNYWVDGLVQFSAGINDGASVEISGYSMAGGAVLTKLPLAYTPVIGDTGTIYRGCNKTPQDCCDKWNNMNNYRGEPTGIPKSTPVVQLQTSVPISTTTTTPASGPSGTLTATPAELKVLRFYLNGVFGSPNPAATQQCIRDGFLIVLAPGETTISAAGLQQVHLSGYNTKPGPVPGGVS